MVLATVGDSFTSDEMFTGRGGRFGSNLGLFVGIGFWEDMQLFNLRTVK